MLVGKLKIANRKREAATASMVTEWKPRPYRGRTEAVNFEQNKIAFTAFGGQAMAHIRLTPKGLALPATVTLEPASRDREARTSSDVAVSIFAVIVDTSDQC